MQNTIRELHSQPVTVSAVQKSKAEQTEITSFLEKWLLSARVVNADCTSKCWAGKLGDREMSSPISGQSREPC